MKKKYIIISALLLQVAIFISIFVYTPLGAKYFSSDITGTSQEKNSDIAPRDGIVIVLPSKIQLRTPFTLDDNTRVVLKNIYEPLVDFDENLRIIPVLATSWGMISPTLWEFQLRENVVFHNGDAFTADDVISTFSYMKQYAPDEMKEVFGGIQDIKKLSPYKISIETKQYDPLFLSKMRYLFIISQNTAKQKNVIEDITKIPGTGAYLLHSSDEKTIVLTQFNRFYHQEDAVYKTLRFLITSSRFERIALLENKEADVVLSLPEGFISTVQHKGYSIISMPTLESVFVLYNFKGIFQDKEKRKMFLRTLNFNDIPTIIGQLGTLSFQFVSSGVFGFNPDLVRKDIPSSQEMKPLPEKMFVTLKLVQGNKYLGDFFVENARRFNIKIELSVVDDATLLSDLTAGNGDLFLLGWKFSDGDIRDFYNAIIHSRNGGKGVYNGLGYDFKDADEWIEQSNKEVDVQKRLTLLQKVMKKITEEYIIGIPLFESHILYAVAPGIVFTPSMDGTINYRNFR